MTRTNSVARLRALVCLGSLCVACRQHSARETSAGTPSARSNTANAAALGASANAARPSSAAIAPSASAATLNGAASGGAPGSGASAVVLPLLDPKRAELALLAYTKFHVSFCASKASGGRVADLLRAGFANSAHWDRVCPGVAPFATALASGALLDSRADEVLLETASGGDRAFGEHTLALMRRDGGDYALVRHFLVGNEFEAKLRARSASGHEFLMLCERSGSMGLYPSTCGFLGQGSFAFSNAERAISTADEFRLVFVTACGKASSIALGKLDLHGDHLAVSLRREDAVLEPRGPDEADGGFCSKKTHVVAHEFTLEFELGERRVKRLTPIPRELTSVLDHL